MSKVYEQVKHCFESIKDRIPFETEVALVLGYGLGDFSNQVEIAGEIPYGEIPGFPISTVAGHDGRFIFGKVGEKKVVIMKGRVHYYEGYEMSQVVLPIRMMKMMGAKILFLTNAAGGINSMLEPGDFMMLTDHIAQFVPSPLIGENPEEFGVRFPDMSNIYDEALQDHIKAESKKLGIPV